MYSEFMSTTGMSQGTMETIVLSVIAVFILGFILVMYWPFIIAGAAALFCVVVLANHKVPDAPKPKPVEVLDSKVQVDEAIAKPVEKVIQSEPFDESKAFIQDCVALTDYSKDQCRQIWEGRETQSPNTEQVKFKLLKVDNEEYKARRDKALQKPNAVVGHFVYN